MFKVEHLVMWIFLKSDRESRLSYLTENIVHLKKHKTIHISIDIYKTLTSLSTTQRRLDTNLYKLKRLYSGLYLYKVSLLSLSLLQNINMKVLEWLDCVLVGHFSL